MMAENWPRASVVFSSLKVDISGLVISTLTPAGGAPAASTTVPRRRPCSMAWAAAAPAASRSSAQASARRPAAPPRGTGGRQEFRLMGGSLRGVAVGFGVDFTRAGDYNDRGRRID